MKIKIIKRIVPEHIAMEFTPIEIGTHEIAHMNKNGAVSVRSQDDEMVGVKLDEFEFLTEDDREEWIKIAHPNIPVVSEDGEQGFEQGLNTQRRRALRKLLREKLSEEDYEVLSNEDLNQIINAVITPDDVLARE